MRAENQKPRTCRSKHQKPRTLTAAQREIHRMIATQSEQCQATARPWRPEEYPHLWRLVEAAKAEAQSRQRLPRKIAFNHEGRRYSARFTGFDRIIVEDWITGRFIASSGFFAL